jgi:CBS domain-containing protein
MKIEDLMTRRVVAARSDTDLSHVARLMWDNDCGCVPVVDAEDKLVGILTDRDLAMSANFAGRALRELRAAGCMASEILTCQPEESPFAVAKRMGAKRVRRVPVTDAAGRLVGIVSIGDLLCAADKASPKEKKALQAALLGALTAICARPSRAEVAPVPPTGKRATAPKSPKPKAAAKKRAKV